MKGKLFFVGSPIGNLKDFSINQQETLKSVDLILCEDTRTSRTLLSYYNINKPLLSFHKFNYKEMIPKVIDKLLSGENIALISDAGMPVISDPGGEIIEKLIENEIPYTVIGGVSAFLNAYILSGFSTPFTFIGFLPNKQSERKKLLLDFKFVNSTLIFYSSVHKINDDIKDLFEHLGDRKICIARELTKCFEEITFSTLKEGYNKTLKGEFVIVVEKNKETEKEDLSYDIQLERYLKLGYTKNESIKLIAKENNISKKEVYDYFIKREEWWVYWVFLKRKQKRLRN